MLWRRGWDGAWQAQYRFDLRPYRLADYGEMCRHHQTSPKSHFTRSWVCTRMTAEGRVTLTALDGARQERPAGAEALWDWFGLAGVEN